MSGQAARIDRARARQALRREAHPEPDAARCAELEAQARDEIPASGGAVCRTDGVAADWDKDYRRADAVRLLQCEKQAACFSWRLMDYPDAVIDYVVVRELAHIVHKNHGPPFSRQLVERYMPDYKRRRAMLRRIGTKEWKTKHDDCGDCTAGRSIQGGGFPLPK